MKKNNTTTRRLALRDHFLFYENYWKAVRNLPDEIELEVITAIIELSLYGIEPVLSREADDAFSIIRMKISRDIRGGQHAGTPKPMKL